MSGSFASNPRPLIVTQSAIPINPVVGMIWTETIDSVPVATWNWNGTDWISNIIYDSTYGTVPHFGVSVNFNFPFRFTNTSDILFRQFRFAGRIDHAVSPGGATDSNTNFYSFDVRLAGGAGQSGTITGLTPLTTQSTTYTAFSNILLQSPFLASRIVINNTTSLNNTSTARAFVCDAAKTGGATLSFSNSHFLIAYNLIRK